MQLQKNFVAVFLVMPWSKAPEDVICQSHDVMFQVVELATVKRPQERAYALQRWQEDGGIMIIGYEMYRNLTQGRNIKSKKLKETFQKTLVDPGEHTAIYPPEFVFMIVYFSYGWRVERLTLMMVLWLTGPDFVICDEGHVLKNEASAVSKAMNSIRTRRRVVLTGTPLQNNLIECKWHLSIIIQKQVCGNCLLKAPFFMDSNLSCLHYWTLFPHVLCNVIT